MKQRAVSFARWTSPMKSPPKGVLKGMSQRFAVAGFIAASFALMVLGKAEPILVERARTTVTDLFAPVLEGITRPISVTAHAIENAELLLAAFEENKELRAENAKLLQWERVARAIEAENKSLKALLNFVPDDAQKYLTARVVGDFGGAFVRSVLINAGQDRNVEKGQAVLGASALVGRVAEAGARSSRVLLVTDINSRIPVIVAETRFRAILAGNNSDRPDLLYLPEDALLQSGDRIVTSGHGGQFPPGLPIAEVVDVDDTGHVLLSLLDDQHRLEFVRIVDFGLKPPFSPKTAPSGPAIVENADTASSGSGRTETGKRP